MKRILTIILMFAAAWAGAQTNSFDVQRGTIRKHLYMVPNASAPSAPLMGTLYFDTDTNYYWFDGVQWQQFGGGDIYWTLSGDTLGTSYNVRLDSSFLMQAGKWHIGYAKEDQHDDNADSLVYLGYCDYNNTGKVSTIEVRKNDSDTNYYIYMYARSAKGSTQYTQTDSTIVINSENIYMPDITATGKKFEHLVGMSPDGRLFPQPLASGYDSITYYAKASGTYGKENILDVGAAGETYSDFSTAVAAASAGDVIEVSNATFTESGTVTMPTGSTLKIYEGGLLTGTFTLVGDNTRLDAGLYQCFGSGVTITGTWIVDRVLVDWFGAIGLPDEGTEIQAAIDFCEKTSGRTLTFQNKDYYSDAFILYWEGGGTLEGNGAIIKHTYNSATEYEELLRIYGSIGTYDTLAVDAVYGSYILDVPAGSALLSLNRGDMVKIISDEDYLNGGDLTGEMKIVDTVIAAGRNVKFTEPLYHTYLATDNARMAKVTPGEAVIKNITFFGLAGRNYTLGLELKYINRPVLQGVEFHNFKYSALGMQDCFAGSIDIVANNAMGSTGLGYGIALYGASMSNVITCRGFSLRHITSTGGNGSQGGIPYNNLFVDCIGSGVYAHAYDLHKACGTGNKYVNCRASAGVAIGDTANFQGQWSAVVTYDNNDIIAIPSDKNQHHQLYKSTQNGNLNNSPLTDLGTYWEVYNNAIYGIYTGCSDVTIENCQMEGFYAAYGLLNNNQRNIRVDGLIGKNCRYAICFGTDTLSNSSFNNVQLQNETFKDDAFSLYFSNSILNKVSFSNISAKGAFGIFLSGTSFTDKKLEINTLVADGVAEISSQTPEVHLNIGSAFITQQSTPGYILSTATTSNGLKSININNLTVQGAAARPIGINSHLTSLSFGNVILTDGSTTAFIDNTDSIDVIDIGYIHNDGSGAIYYCENTGGYIGTLNVKNSPGNSNNAPFNSAAPANRRRSALHRQATASVAGVMSISGQ